MILLILIEARHACGQNDIFSPQMDPTLSPTLSVFPTMTPPPSAHPSASPTEYPTVQPSISFSPTISPKPSAHPSWTPTAMPSLNATTIAIRYYTQTFQAETEFEIGQVAIFKKFMESYTDSLEYGVTDHILTQCIFVSQFFNDTTGILSIDYAMNYITKYINNYENMRDYPDQFYASQNMTALTEQLASSMGFSDAFVALELVMLDIGEVITAAPVFQPTLNPDPATSFTSTNSPTRMITGPPTEDFIVPTVAAGDGESVDSNNADENQDPDSPPITDPSSNSEVTGIAEDTPQNTGFGSTVAPSPSPQIDDLSTNTDQNSEKSRLGVGLGVGIFVATVVCVGLLLTWLRFHKREQPSLAAARSTATDQGAREAPQDNPSLLIINSEGMESPKSFSDEEFYRPLHTLSHDADLEAAQTDSIQADGYTTGAFPEQGNVVMPMLITDLDGSETSSDFLGELSVNENEDIFDNYKDNQLEELREGVTSSVAETEGMMSLALTQSLIGGSDLAAEDILDGAGNPSEIEANFLYETNDWLKKNQESPVDAHEFFQELLNKTVAIVRIGVIHPLDASRVIYCCSAILGLELLKDFPNDTLLVQGMRKTNDASQGRTYLVDAFKEFGAIEGAAIALEKGFGFVRFVHPRSAEIEVQGVSVMIYKLRLSD
jgi:hypothetical protein